MKVPRDVSARDLTVALRRLGYEPTRQAGSHIRLTTTRGGEHHVTIPAHDPLKIGTLNAILRALAEHHDMTRDQLLLALFE